MYQEAEIFQNVSISFRAALPVAALEIPSPADEKRVIHLISEYIAIPQRMQLFTWDSFSGVRKLTDEGAVKVEDLNLIQAFDWIEKLDGDALIILCDTFPYLAGENKDPVYIRGLKNLANSLQWSGKRLILLGTQVNLPEESFGGLVEQFKITLPNPSQIAEIVKATTDDIWNTCQESLSVALDELAIFETTSGTKKYEEKLKELRATVAKYKNFSSDFSKIRPEKIPDRLIKAFQGLPEQTISKTLRACSVKYGRLHSEEVIAAANEKKLERLKNLGVEFINPPKEEVGGLNNLKKWLVSRSKLFGLQDTELPAPKGILLVGPPGTGKSYAAKTIGYNWGIPIIRFDLGKLFNSLVGESEANMRRLLLVIEAVAPVVVLVDEIDKTFASTSGSTDSGVSSRLFGYFLTWMQEKTAPVFVVATANKIDHLPPELTRKGRFDEIFFVDLPQVSERVDIAQVFNRRLGLNLDLETLSAIAENTPDFTGAEIESLFNEVAIFAYNSGEPPTLKCFEEFLGEISPQARQPATAQYLHSLREWSQTVRSASSKPIEGKAAMGKKSNNNSKVRMAL